jgi:hypothetical protein
MRIVACVVLFPAVVCTALYACAFNESSIGGYLKLHTIDYSSICAVQRNSHDATTAALQWYRYTGIAHIDSVVVMYLRRCHSGSHELKLFVQRANS